MINTAIEWATHTLNFWWGCTKVSPACAHCYAEMMAKLFSRGKATWGPAGARWLRFDACVKELAKIVRQAEKTGVRPRVFMNSMSDTFEDNPLLDATRCMMFVLLAETSGADFLLLTKRPENIRRMVPPCWLEAGKWPAHVWAGTTVENREMADLRIPPLLEVPAAVRFLSMEPLLGPVEFANVTRRSDCIAQLGKPMLAGIHWVIVGGESGGQARPMHPDWVRSLRDQCTLVAGVPFFFKQWGEWAPGEHVGDRDRVRTATWFNGWRYGSQTQKQSENCHSDDAPDVYHIGKKAAGRLLDGREWSEVPEVRA